MVAVRGVSAFEAILGAGLQLAGGSQPVGRVRAIEQLDVYISFFNLAGSPVGAYDRA
jgi:hypothetical protein